MRLGIGIRLGMRLIYCTNKYKSRLMVHDFEWTTRVWMNEWINGWMDVDGQQTIKTRERSSVTDSTTTIIIEWMLVSFSTHSSRCYLAPIGPNIVTPECMEPSVSTLKNQDWSNENSLQMCNELVPLEHHLSIGHQSSCHQQRKLYHLHFSYH